MTYSGYGYNQQDWDSEYDSTWEDDEEDKQPKTKRAFQQFSSQRRAARDLQNYRHGYPENYRHGYPDASPKPNLLFYQNKMPFEPHGEYIDEIHRSWRYDYDELERNHNFIQWLFPLREPGVNRCATPLTLSEIQLMKKDKAVMKRFLESYKLMLGFYGIVLLDPDTGAVAPAEENWNDRFQNLNRNTHNNLRITRILKCLGEMGYEKFQAPLVRFFLEETLCNGNLPNVKQSALDYFMFTVKDKKERQNLVHFAWVHNKPENKFIWGPVEKLQKFNPPPQNAEQDAEVDISEEVKIQMPSENDSSEGDKEFAETENKRERGLVRRTVGYVCRPFLFFSRLLFIPFLAIFRFLFRPFRYFFGGGIFWFRGEARNEDGFNEEQISTKTEGTKTERTKVAAVNMSVEYKESEHEPLLEDPGRQKTHKAEFKELNVRADVKTDNSMDESKTEANRETEANGSTRKCIPENGTGLADKKPLVCIKIPEYTKATEDDDNTENEYYFRNFTKGTKFMKLDEGQTSENDQLEGAEEGSETEDDAGNGEVSDVHTEDSEADNHGGGRGHGGTRIANAGNHIEETKIYNVKSEVEDASKVKCEGDDAEKAKINKIEYHTETSTVRLGDNDGGDFGPQNTLSGTYKTDQVESDDGKTKTEEVVNEKLSPHVGEKGDEDENPNISKIEENRGAAVPGSGDNGGENIGAQITEPEKDQSQQVERVCHDLYSNSENEEGTSQ